MGRGDLIPSPHFTDLHKHYPLVPYILTHTSNAKCFRKVALLNIRGLAEIIELVRGYGRLSPNQVMIKREGLTDEVLL